MCETTFCGFLNYSGLFNTNQHYEPAETNENVG